MHGCICIVYICIYLWIHVYVLLSLTCVEEKNATHRLHTKEMILGGHFSHDFLSSKLNPFFKREFFLSNFAFGMPGEISKWSSASFRTETIRWPEKNMTITYFGDILLLREMKIAPPFQFELHARPICYWIDDGDENTYLHTYIYTEVLSTWVITVGIKSMLSNNIKNSKLQKARPTLIFKNVGDMYNQGDQLSLWKSRTKCNPANIIYNI
jgi:hypothetical protein